MAKSTNGGKTKAPNGGTKAIGGETKARRAPVRRTTKKTAETPIAVASDVATIGQTAATGTAVIAAGATALAGSNPIIDLDPEDVRRRAYEIYCGRGCAGGSAEADWLEAERQLRTSLMH
jgi:hypothetical protein